MFLKNIKYAFRNLQRDQFYTFLNGIGLTIGMTVALLIFMWVQDETSYDNYHSENGQNYLILSNTSFGGERNWGIRTPAPLQSAIKEQIPEVQNVARTSGLWKPILKYENFLLNVDNTFLIDPELFQILDFEFIQGDPKTALSNPNSIIITDEKAYKIFGNENPMGKTVKLGDKLDLEITGIIKKPPSNTHLPVDCFLPFENNVGQFYNEGSLHWRSFNFSTYLTLRPGSDVNKIGKKISTLFPIVESEAVKDRSYAELHPVQDIYLGLGKVKYSFAKGDPTAIKLFGWIAFIILLIASINYINLTTARAAHRAKATGIKKIVGASRSQLIGQHVMETVCLVGICSLGALLLTQIGLPYFKEISGKEFSSQTVFSLTTIGLTGLLALVTVLLSGIQPALQLSAFRPVQVLKGSGFKGVDGKSGLRKFLVVAQFVSSAALIICTVFMLRQMDFIQSKKLGYEKEHIFKFSHNNENTKILKTALENESAIKDIAISDQSIVSITNSISGIGWEGTEGRQELQLFSMHTGPNMKDFFGLEMKSGRWFNRSTNLDSTSFVINESAAKAMQLEDPVGKWVDMWGARGTIVGLVKDFHFQSFHSEIKPLIFRQTSDWFPTMYVKTQGEDASLAIAAVEKIFKQHSPNEVFKYEFLDETFNKLYQTETKTGSMFFLFSLIAIIISCLGVFGLATYTAEKRFKEIGIRKVLGASALSIINLLSKDFLKLVFVALIIAIPLAWYFMKNWLNNFAFHVDLDWWVFAMAGLIAIGIALATVVFQSARAAMSDPVESIRSE
ncbi:MAG: ABC transporter permease [Saprospiraceae bacterium]